MKLTEVNDRIAEAREVIESEFGKIEGALGVFPGTGWKEGMDQCFQGEQALPYSMLKLPGMSRTDEVPGHSRTLELGRIGDKTVFRLGRIHANESKAVDVSLATRVVLGAIAECLQGLIVTHGVGSLHGLIEIERGLIQSLVRSIIIDIQGWAIRGRRKERVNPGDLAIVEQIATRHFGTGTPLLAGEFIDSYHNGLHRDNDKWFNIARRAIAEVQGRAPRVVYVYVPGPQFEHLNDKLAFRAAGGDVIGMSGHEVSLATLWDIPVAQLVLVANSTFAPHSHQGNQNMGKTSASKTRAVLQRLVSTWS